MAKHPHKAPAAADTASPDTNLPHQVCTFARIKSTIYKSAKLRLAPITPNLRSDLNRIGALAMKFTLSKMARNLQVFTCAAKFRSDRTFIERLTVQQ